MTSKGTHHKAKVQDGRLEVPLRSLAEPVALGFAHRVAVVDCGLHFDLVFLQQEWPLNDVFVGFARLIVPLEDVLTNILGSTREFHETIRHLLIGTNYESVLPLTGPSPYPVSAAAVVANLFHFVRAGSVGEVNAYFLSARSLHLARTENGELSFQPLGSIQMSLQALLGLLDHLSGLEPELTRRLAEFRQGAI